MRTRTLTAGMALWLLTALSGAGEARAQRVGALQSLMVNGRSVNRDMTPRMIEGTMMVPLRFVAEYLGAGVRWEPDQRLVRVMRGNREFTMTVGTTRATVNGEGRALGMAPVIRGGRTLIPLREVARFFDAQVMYNPNTRTVFVNTVGGGDGPPAMGAGGGGS